ncbi:MAG: nucleotide exchange factor GrpE [Phycisphaerales bacterium]|nr:nucleotide exchange factor GrpE [Phycisphaerales bacterium]
MTQKKDKIATATEEEIGRYASQAADKQPDGTPTETVEESKKSEPSSTEEQIAALKADRDALKDKLLRSQAECANISKRLHQQHAEALKLAGMNLARSLLPVLDSFERTFSTLEKSALDDPVVQGVKLIADDFQKAFRDHGITPIEAQGKPFDPMQHEAMMQDHETDLPSGTVTQELQRGYTMQDRVLRPAKVAVAAAKPETKEEKKAETEE